VSVGPDQARRGNLILELVVDVAFGILLRKAVTSALADGAITPEEAATIAAVADTFVRAIETSDFERRLKLVEDDFAGGRRPGRGNTFQLLGEVPL
jgi:TRAP-type C4-dicarboxylate transport system permease large subunit